MLVDVTTLKSAVLAARATSEETTVHNAIDSAALFLVTDAGRVTPLDDGKVWVVQHGRIYCASSTRCRCAQCRKHGICKHIWLARLLQHYVTAAMPQRKAA